MAFDDARRLKTLRDYRLLDTAQEDIFDNITRVTARLFETSMALITLVDEHRQWFKSHHGLPVAETPREQSFCDHAVRNDEPLLVPDARADARFVDNPLVTGAPHIRFYCGVPLHASDGQCLGTLCILDSTPRRLEPGQLEMLAALGRQVELELELRRRLTILEDALGTERREKRQKELLAAMIVHDLRSPLTSILMAVPALKVTDEDSRLALMDILGEAERMRRMLADLLDLSLHGMGELRLRRSDFVLQEHVRDVVAAIDSRDVSGPGRVRMELSPEVILMHADAEMLGRVVRNLVGNALHHGPEGAPVRVTVMPLAAGGARLEVHDCGATIPPQVRNRIFAPFEQAVPGVRSQEGYGLGLAFCRMAVEAHGGRLSIVDAAADGDGNTFHIDLPTQQT